MPIIHTDHEYETELQTLRTHILDMGRAAEEMIAKSNSALVKNDPAQAKDMTRTDNVIDRLEIKIDALCLRLLARRQPVASDLRFIAAAFKSATILERIGDIAVSISERVIELHRLSPGYVSNEHMQALALYATQLFHNALQAFAGNDAQKARAVINSYEKLSKLHANVTRPLVEDEGGTLKTEQVLKTEAIAKAFGRLGGHATNLSEMVIFMVTGEDVRHAKDFARDVHADTAKSPHRT